MRKQVRLFKIFNASGDKGTRNSGGAARFPFIFSARITHISHHSHLHE
ncbi:hypothetical protein GGR08_000590 [Bartonella fuyuanensis]|uniref:Uncharacterized protein n=1 Tax=Bartonella fuyuanensis TaxID=1460968 RepID=A0A840E072_9HYPH|nr:hypothetical protein [Bartonella fuyuanensis]